MPQWCRAPRGLGHSNGFLAIMVNSTRARAGTHRVRQAPRGAARIAGAIDGVRAQLRQLFRQTSVECVAGLFGAAGARPCFHRGGKGPGLGPSNRKRHDGSRPGLLRRAERSAFGAFAAAVTDSYPFGPGDGCFGMAKTGYAGCELGSGCRSGSGSIAYVAEQVRYELVTRRVREEVEAWLHAKLDGHLS